MSRVRVRRVSRLAFDIDSAGHYADILAARRRAGRPISAFDAQIAALCRQYKSALATRNTADFTDTGIQLPLLGPCCNGAVVVDQRPVDVEQHEAHWAGGGHRPMIAERPTVVRRRIRY